jgi:hypothetical protein
LAFSLVLFSLTATSYFVASVAFVAFLAGRITSPGALRWAARLVGAGAALHAGHIIVSSLVLHICPIRGMHFAMSVVSVLACGVYLLVRLRYPIDVLGAFFAPIALTFLLASQIIGVSDASGPGAGMRSAILPVHVAANLLGEALFLLAFAAAVAYLVQENQLKKKRLGGLMTRLPPLDALDRAEHRFLLAGFPLLTVGILTGALWARRVEAGSVADMWRAAFSYATWMLFAVVLLLRAAAGWRGRRAAYGTIAGFGFAVVVLVIYLLRSLSPAAHLALLEGR